jgi:hypothetical protein
MFSVALCVFMYMYVSAVSFSWGWLLDHHGVVTAFQLQITLQDFMKCVIYIVLLMITQHGGYQSFWGGRGDPFTGIAFLWIPTGYNSFAAFVPVVSLVIASSFVCCGTQFRASSSLE